MEPHEKDRMPFLQLVPNLVTIAGMGLGLTSIRFAMGDRYEFAVVLILLAGLIDGLDGLLARRLHATSDFGAELDSLSDFLCFGVAPSLLVYRFALGETHAFGWIFVLIYTGAACLRLARFNVMRSEPDSMRHFTGVPAPAGALLALLPLFITLSGIGDARSVPVLVAIWLGLVGALMISRIKTFSPKALKIPRGAVSYALIGTVIAVGMIFTKIWLLMVILVVIYALLLVPAIWRARGMILRG
ncbi:CDP-diacylglycerol--serine O-phosphatidyltransferase [Thioclava sp. BHET1]|uniref:CDP-diacylglycerol--serine O-phosphatidyltransferase n=1 Tax=Thioclava dalianensis TaxID=1185766 RepID=A0A074TGX9_9RHOB|nr:CDP-diacylglycerol--serine O-phosphatidyltransferase [Thioclava dalianensis]KEP70971.1 CDP-alcohol phosphatidyltransferase [Thioclava dalianensis]TMV91091.1 CDP-diacylglycerol--serine O-phosphatidyltransferase [Thioclava sp. BHET1]SFN27867.1 CDP-diacylglycerol---serine O-phosphatidyltransferase [Thioclava dalianensis]